MIYFICSKYRKLDAPFAIQTISRHFIIPEEELLKATKLGNYLVFFAQLSVTDQPLVPLIEEIIKQLS